MEKLQDYFEMLVIEQGKLEEKEKSLIETKNNLDAIAENINNLNDVIKKCDDPKVLMKKLDEFDKQFKYDLSTLDSNDNKIEKNILITYFEDSKYTPCGIFQKNCHEVSDC